MFSHLEEYIYKLFSSINVTKPTDLDMELIAAKLNVEIIYTKRAFRLNNEILLNNGNREEQWIEFGHEICHFLRHVGNQLNMNEDFRFLQEWQADHFAYHFCVPTFMLEQYQLANYYNIEDGVPVIAKDFNVTEEFARKRLIHYRNKLQQAKSDQEHREFMERLYPKAPPYSDETMKVMEELSSILYKRGIK